MTEPLHGAVVQVAVADRIAGRRQRRSVDDRHLVVVRADVDAAARCLEHRVIAPVVPDRQTVRLRARAERQQLVAQADAEDRRTAPDRPAGQRPHGRDLRVHPRRVAGPRRQDDEVRGAGEDVRGARVGRQDRDLEPAGREGGQQRTLDAVVDERRAGDPLPFRADRVRIAGPHARDMVDGPHGAMAPASATASSSVTSARRMTARRWTPRRSSSVSARVSIPVSAGMPASTSSSSSEMPGPDGGVTRREQMSARACTRLDSSSAAAIR